MSAADDIEAKQGKRNRQAEAKRTRDKRISRTVVTALMSSPDGRRWIWLQLEAAQVFAQTYVPGSFDQTAFAEGNRRFGNKLLAEIQMYAIADFVRMLQENNPTVEEIQDVGSPDAI